MCGRKLRIPETADVDVDTLTIDHVVPKVYGGSEHIDNLMPACRECNARKANRMTPELWAKVEIEKQRKEEMRRNAVNDRVTMTYLKKVFGVRRNKINRVDTAFEMLDAETSMNDEKKSTVLQVNNLVIKLKEKPETEVENNNKEGELNG